jgi:hypothetical protein
LLLPDFVALQETMKRFLVAPFRSFDTSRNGEALSDCSFQTFWHFKKRRSAFWLLLSDRLALQETVKRFLVAPFRSFGTSRNGEALSGGFLKRLTHSHVTCNFKFSHLIVIWLKIQAGGPDVVRGPD